MHTFVTGFGDRGEGSGIRCKFDGRSSTCSARGAVCYILGRLLAWEQAERFALHAGDKPCSSVRHIWSHGL